MSDQPDIRRKPYQLDLGLARHTRSLAKRRKSAQAPHADKKQHLIVSTPLRERP